jgi:hypothetical protein
LVLRIGISCRYFVLGAPSMKPAVAAPLALALRGGHPFWRPHPNIGGTVVVELLGRARVGNGEAAGMNEVVLLVEEAA